MIHSSASNKQQRWLSPLAHVKYLYLFAPKPQHSQPVSAKVLEDTACIIAASLSEFRSWPTESWYLTIGLGNVEHSRVNKIPEYCHLRVYENSRLTTRIDEKALPYALENFGDRRGFNEGEIIRKHVPQ
jgi:hypothetical protein